jgi:N-acetylglutamate synthase-like GNAT family acetyltransferase
MQIVSLVDHVDCIPALAQLHHEEWSHVSPFKGLDQHAAKLRSRIGLNPVPATYILLIEHTVAGSVSLLPYDDIANLRPDLSPWLASLLVVPRHRGRGYGRALVGHCVGCARALGFRTLYLYTDTHTDYYARLGWHPIEERTSRGLEVTVMELPLMNLENRIHARA